MGSSPDIPPPTPAKVDTKKTRAKHACRECNSRRVRCDVTEKQPCSHCLNSGAKCEVLPSRRGRYPRRSRRLRQPSEGGFETAPSQSQTPQPMVRKQSSDAAVSLPNTTGTPSTTTHHDGQNDPRQDECEARGATPMSSPVRPTGTLFFGESNFLTLVPGNDGVVAKTSAEGSQKPRLTFPIPATPRANGDPLFESPGISAATMRYLRDEGALTLPDLQSCLPAIESYFKWFHPSYPILDRADVTRRLASMSISRILLQAMLYIGSTYCDNETILAMGFKDRYEAKRLLYTRARLLFHADWEKDEIVLIQSIFLMSFWRGVPTDVRNVRYWLGVAITLAESYGLHRSPRSISKTAHAGRMRRRIWWAIYVREKQTASHLGLPSRIRDLDCDIEPLSPSDLESEVSCKNSPFGSCLPEHITYVIKMVEMAKLLGRIIDMHFVPGRSSTVGEVQDLNTALEAWRSDLPEDMKYTSDETASSVWACLLHLAYNHLRILIHRNSFLRNEGSEGSKVVLQAACRISRIVEDMSTQGTLRHGQMHLVAGTFAALCIHTISIRREVGVARRLAEHRAETCLLCLKEVQKYWRINNNVLDLFLHYLDRSIAARLHGTQLDTASNEATEDIDKSDMTISAPETDVVSPVQGESNGQGPMLAPGQARAQEDIMEEQYFNLINGNWEGDDTLGDLGLFLQADDLTQAGGGLKFLERSL